MVFSGSHTRKASAALDPVERMRRERRLALLIFNGLLLIAACLQLFSLSSNQKEPPAETSSKSAPAMEWHE